MVNNNFETIILKSFNFFFVFFCMLGVERVKERWKQNKGPKWPKTRRMALSVQSLCLDGDCILVEEGRLGQPGAILGLLIRKDD